MCSWCTFNRDVAPRVTSAGRTVKRCGRWPTPGKRSPPPVVTVRLLIAGDTRLAGSLHWAYRQLIASDNAHFEVGFYSFGATSFVSQAFCFCLTPSAVCSQTASASASTTAPSACVTSLEHTQHNVQDNHSGRKRENVAFAGRGSLANC